MPEYELTGKLADKLAHLLAGTHDEGTADDYLVEANDWAKELEGVIKAYYASLVPEKMIEEVEKILKNARSGVKVTSNGTANFIEYPTSTKEAANQILSLLGGWIEEQKKSEAERRVGTTWNPHKEAQDD